MTSVQEYFAEYSATEESRKSTYFSEIFSGLSENDQMNLARDLLRMCDKTNPMNQTFMIDHFPSKIKHRYSANGFMGYLIAVALSQVMGGGSGPAQTTSTPAKPDTKPAPKPVDTKPEPKPDPPTDEDMGFGLFD
jgi:hypothetical protein